VVVLLVFAAGFFTMHGFLAVSASAAAHAAPKHAVVTGGPTPEQPGPAEHHELVAGCVVALVGIGLAGIALLSLRRSRTDGARHGFVSEVVRAIGPSAARWSPPRVALCIIRV